MMLPAPLETSNWATKEWQVTASCVTWNISLHDVLCYWDKEEASGDMTRFWVHTLVEKLQEVNSSTTKADVKKDWVKHKSDIETLYKETWCQFECETSLLGRCQWLFWLMHDEDDNTRQFPSNIFIIQHSGLIQKHPRSEPSRLSFPVEMKRTIEALRAITTGK